MAEITAINGTEIFVQVAGTSITGQVSGNVSLARDLIEITNKDSPGQAKAYLAQQGEYGGEIQCSFNFDDGGAENFAEAFADFTAGTSQTITFGQTASGGLYVTASGIVRDIEWTGDKASVSTCSVTYQLTGAITTATVA